MEKEKKAIAVGLLSLATVVALATLTSSKIISFAFNRGLINYEVVFNSTSGKSVYLAARGGTYVATVNSGSDASGYFTKLSSGGYITFDFDSASKSGGVEKFQSLESVSVIASDSVIVKGSNYQNAWDNDGECFIGEYDAESGLYTFPYSMNYVSVFNAASGDNNISSITLKYECSSPVRPDDVSSLSTPTGLSFVENTSVLSWNSVSNAIAYVVTINGEDYITRSTSVDLSACAEAGQYSVSVKAKHNNIESTTASENIEILYLDVDQILEAEDACLSSKYLITDSKAHGGAYGGDFNDCGEGMYYRYYAFEAGNRDIVVTYSTGSVNSYHSLFVNGTKVCDVTYTVNTGWFGSSHKTADVTINNVPLAAGWNELYLIKNGTSSDNPSYGGWAQVDYITVKGSNNKYKLSTFDRTSYTYNLEAECGKFACTSNKLPERWEGNFTMGYGLGNMDTQENGVQFRIYLPAGTYDIRPVLGGNDTNSKNLLASFDDGTQEVKNFGSNTSWDNPVIAPAGSWEVTVSAGLHTIDLRRNGSWFTLDRVVVERIA